MKKILVVILLLFVVAAVSLLTTKSSKNDHSSNSNEKNIKKKQITRIKSTGTTTRNSSLPSLSQKAPLYSSNKKMRIIIGLEKNKSYRSRLREVSKLSNELSKKDINSLLSFLQTNYNSEKQDLSERAYNAIKNDALLALVNQMSKFLKP